MSEEDLDVPTLVYLLAGHLRRRVQTHPTSTLALAAGAGYVLAAGLPDALLRAGGAFALRAASSTAFGELLGPARPATASPGRRGDPVGQHGGRGGNGAPADPRGDASFAERGD